MHGLRPLRLSSLGPLASAGFDPDRVFNAFAGHQPSRVDSVQLTVARVLRVDENHLLGNDCSIPTPLRTVLIAKLIVVLYETYTRLWVNNNNNNAHTAPYVCIRECMDSFFVFFLCTVDNRIRAPRTQWPGVIDCVFLSGRRENGDRDGDDEENNNNNNKKNLIQKNIRHVDPGRGNRGSSTTHATCAGCSTHVRRVRQPPFDQDSCTWRHHHYLPPPTPLSFPS